MADTRELTLTDKKKLEEELEQLIEAKKQVAEEIKIARGFGDLSENAEYDAAKKEEARVCLWAGIGRSRKSCAGGFICK